MTLIAFAASRDTLDFSSGKSGIRQFFFGKSDQIWLWQKFPPDLPDLNTHANLKFLLLDFAVGLTLEFSLSIVTN